MVMSARNLTAVFLWFGIVLAMASFLPAQGGCETGEEFQVNGNYPNRQWFPSAAMSDDGSFVVAWRHDEDGYPQRQQAVFARVFNRRGEPIGDEFQVNEDLDQHDPYPDVAMDAGGNFVVVWARLPSIMVRLYRRNGQPRGGEFQVNLVAPGWHWPEVAMRDDGGFVVTWSSSVAGVPEVMARLFDETGIPVGAEFTVSSTPEAALGLPSVAMAGDGRFVIARHSGPPSGEESNIFVRLFNAGGDPLGDHIRVNEPTGGVQVDPSVAMSDGGDFVVAWRQIRGPDGSLSPGIFARRFDAGGNRLGEEIEVNTFVEGRQKRPSVSMDGEGSFVVAWEGSDVEGPGFDPRPVGEEFLVNTYIDLDQAMPSSAMNSRGDFLIAWTSWMQVQWSLEDIFAKRYTCYFGEDEDEEPDVQDEDEDQDGDGDLLRKFQRRIKRLILPHRLN
jgi:hypothetical protein